MLTRESSVPRAMFDIVADGASSSAATSDASEILPLCENQRKSRSPGLGATVVDGRSTSGCRSPTASPRSAPLPAARSMPTSPTPRDQRSRGCHLVPQPQRASFAKQRSTSPTEILKPSDSRHCLAFPFWTVRGVDCSAG